MTYNKLITIICAQLCFGCAAVGTRINGCCGDYFSGVRGDAMLITGQANKGETGFEPVFGIIDMPFSLVADVVFLPSDIQGVRERSKEKRYPTNEETEQAAPRNR